MAEGFWLFEGLDKEPYGLLPLNKLAGKGGPTSIKAYKRVASYQWYLEDQTSTILIPGIPRSCVQWSGGRLSQDHGIIIYDVNHMKIRTGSLDPAILALNKTLNVVDDPESAGPISRYHFVTDAANLQKLFAFCQQVGDGLFRIDCERVGKTILLNRMEASDLMQVGHQTFDQTLKMKMCKSASSIVSGPFFQLVEYQFGDFRMLVRFEVDAADFAAVHSNLHDDFGRNDPPFEKRQFPENADLSYKEIGEMMSKDTPFYFLTTYPQDAGFPFFTWAQLFFTGADRVMVGWYRGNGDFNKTPALYSLPDISRMMKPLPYAALSKVHDCLGKVSKFLLKNDTDFRCALVWKGKEHLEIFTKLSDAEGAVSDGVRRGLDTNASTVVD